MKILNSVLLSLLILILFGCENKQAISYNSAIIGIWQNTANWDASVEFTGDGEYYIRIRGKRILNNDSIAEKYSYNSLSNGNNLIIYGNPRAGNALGELVVISPGKIKISLVNQGTIVSEAEFTKVKQE